MSKFVVNSYSSNKEILKFTDFIGVNVMVSDSGVVANSDGKKIVPAGTVVGGSTKAVLENPTEPVVSKNTALLGAAAEGVLLYDVDVTYGAKEGSMVIHGFVDLNKLPEAPVAEATAVLTLIKFMK
ncbi:MAG: hypothetical protein GT589_08705 [Peptoclostridium sp.]|uniref:hypothetical protein n=1 Tax=Peptoclostridium sp. TaxID=1904860 RepID=UPI00139DCCB9|nr:hypothetical protein [Peptoclostridium sp.]MZQ76212.1 hypothetical protein [Peptoclostridium sp.]